MSAYALPGLFPPLPVECQHHNVAISSSCYDLAIQEEKIDYNKTRHSSKLQQLTSSRNHQAVEVTVREAKIDCQQLIQSLMTSNTTVKRGRPRRRNSPPYLYSPITPPPPQELAMCFELSVVFKGRHYTVNRSLFRIRQLRQELVDELNNAYDCSSSCFISIPELPELEEKGSAPVAYSNAGQSFSLLHALLRSYAPTLEAWLRKVFAMVAVNNNFDSVLSPTVTQFLLEPLLLCDPSRNNNNTVSTSTSSSSSPKSVSRSSSNRRGRNRQLSGLESIKEHHEEEQD